VLLVIQAIIIQNAFPDYFYKKKQRGTEGRMGQMRIIKEVIFLVAALFGFNSY